MVSLNKILLPRLPPPIILLIIEIYLLYNNYVNVLYIILIIVILLNIFFELNTTHTSEDCKTYKYNELNLIDKIMYYNVMSINKDNNIMIDFNYYNYHKIQDNIMIGILYLIYILGITPKCLVINYKIEIPFNIV
jgi:hypothetical protein